MELVIIAGCYLKAFICFALVIGILGIEWSRILRYGVHC
jgi:hypothetical protein